MTSNIKSAVSYSTVMQLLTKSIDLAAVILYARLLTPSELGIFAIASSIIMLSTELRTLGTNTYIIRTKKISEIDIRRCLGVSLMISWGLALLITFLSNKISDFYAYEDIKQLLLIFAASFIFAPFASVSMALLSKRMQFKRIMILRVLAQALGFALTLWLLALDYSYFAMAWGMFLMTLVEMVLSVYLVHQLNLFIPSFRNLKDVVRFGAISSLISIFRKAESIMPDLIIGKIGTSAHVAITSRAIGTHNFMVEAIFQGAKNVILPYFSGVNEKDPNALMKKFTNANEATMLIAMPVLSAAFIYMTEIISVLFGDQWGSSVPIARVLTTWMLCKLCFYHFDSLLYVLKFEKIILKRQVISTIILSILLILLYEPSLTYIGYALVSMGLFEVSYNSYIMKKELKASLSSYFSGLKYPIYCSVLVFIANSSLKAYFDHTNQVLILMVAALTSGMIWFIFIKSTNNLIRKEFLRARN